MSKTRPKYESSRNRDDYTLHPARRFELEWQPDPGNCYLYALDERTAMMLRKMVAVFPKYYWVWGIECPQRQWDTQTWELWQEISDFVSDVEACLMSGCDLNDLLKVNRMLVAALVGEAVDLEDPAQVSPPNVDYTLTGVVPNLNKYLQHLEVLGSIPGTGDTIQASLQHLVDTSGWTPDTVDDLIDQIEALDPGLLDTFSDLANILIAYKALFPGQTNVHVVKSFYQSWTEKRYWHNHLSIQAVQATALNGIQRALAPFKDDDPTEYGTLTQKLFSIPWLSKALVAVLEPGLIGETLLAAETIADVGNGIAQIIKNAWDIWWNKWINRITTPVPMDTVTGNLTAIADAIANVQPEDQAELDTSGISAAITALAAVLGVEAAALTAAITGIDAQVNVDVTCSSCGSSGGCGCGGGSGIPDNGSSFQPDPAEGQPPGGTGPGGGGVPPGYGGTASQYSEYKCKAANYVYDAVYSGMNVLGGMSTGAAAIAAGSALGSWMLANLVASGAAFTTAGGVVLFSFVAGWEIAAFIAVIAVVSAVAGGGVLYAFYDLATEIDEAKEDIICNLYNAQTVAEAQSVMSDAITTAITDMVITPPYNAFDVAIRSAFSNAVSIFIPNSLFNKLFEQDANVEAYIAAISCDNCCDHKIGIGQDSNPYGSIVSDDGTTIVLDSNFSDQSNRVSIELNGHCNTPYTVSNVIVSSGTVDPTGLTFSAWRFFSPGVSGSVGDVYDSDATPGGAVDNVHVFTVHSSQAFSVTFDYVEYVAP